jgi:hypothetical protein
MALVFRIKYGFLGQIFGESLKKFGKPIKYSKIENLVTLLQITPLVGFLTMAGKNRSIRENFS